MQEEIENTISQEAEAVTGVTSSEVEGTFDFGSALALLKAGRSVTRLGWNGAGMFLTLQVPDEHSKMRRPYIYMYPVDGQLVPWVASQTDMLADDWAVMPL